MSSQLYIGNSQATPSVVVEKPVPMPLTKVYRNVNGKLEAPNTFIDLDGINDIGDYTFYYGYAGYTTIPQNIDLSNLERISGNHACQYMFQNCTGITSADFSSLESISGEYTCNNMFYNCTNLESINLANLTDVTKQYACYYMFNGCTNLQSVDLSKLEFIGDSYACYYMFSGCTSLVSVDLSNLRCLSTTTNNAFNNAYMCGYMFNNCTSLTSIDLSSLHHVHSSGINYMFNNCTSLINADLSNLYSLEGYSPMYSTFRGCTSLQSVNLNSLVSFGGQQGSLSYAFSNCTSLHSLSFPGMLYKNRYNNYDSHFNQMLIGCDTVTVHFPAEWETTMSTWPNVISGFGGTNVTVLWDLPNITNLDMTSIDEILYPYEFSSAFSNCSNIKTVDLSNLKKISGNNSAASIFYNCENLESVDLSGLKEISGSGSCYYMFYYCQKLESISFPSLEKISGSRCCVHMFDHSYKIPSLTFDKLKTIEGVDPCYQMFYQCGNSSMNLYYPALTSVSQGAFDQMLSQVGHPITLHFPSNLESTIQTLTGYPNFGGSQVTILYDLPATE